MTIIQFSKSIEALPPGWRSRLQQELAQPYMKSLQNFIDDEWRRGERIFPESERFFRAFQLTEFEAVKVVVLGQDPYHDLGQANGLAFAVDKGMKTPPSLRNIFREISDDLDGVPPQSTTLEGWAQQGVLLLNTVLSVRAHQAFSHRGKGWEQFTERVIEHLNNHPQPLVFLLWGAPAQEKEKLLTNKQHLILKSPHPSPLSAYRGYFGCRHFSKANSFLEARGRGAIDWLAADSPTVSKS